MSIAPLLSFSSGELDPILTDNVTLEKFKKGLATARNVMIGKTGSILSRFPRCHLTLAKNSGEEIVIYNPPNTDYFLEWGPLYVRVNSVSVDEYNQSVSVTMNVELAHSFTALDLPSLHFVTSKDHVYVFRSGQQMLKLLLNFAGSAFVASNEIFEVLDPLSGIGVTPAGAPSGYDVDYLATVVVNGEESLPVENTTGFAKPIASGQTNVLSIAWPTADLDADEVSEVRVYSRPTGGGAYGFLGSTTKISIVGANHVAEFEDIGSLPDYANGVQDLITKYGLNAQDIIDLHPKTGAVYQQRLLLTIASDPEGILASRPGFPNNFYRDFPHADDSALQFKAGTSGKADVLRIIEQDGLVVFTTNGIYTNNGLLNIDNSALDRRGKWVINEAIPPLVVPGGVFFVDRSNTIRQLVFNQEILAYESIEQTIFSNHLFIDRTITSWAFQDGVTPLIIVCFSDGKWATFTYNFEHQMKAWTRHDSVYPVEQVEGTETNDRTFFVVNKNGQRAIEMSLPRRVPVETKVLNYEWDKLASNAFMDSIKSQFLLLNDLYTFIITPVVAGDWDGLLTISSTGFGLQAVTDTIIKFFNPDDGSEIVLTVDEIVNNDTVIVQPDDEFPSDYSNNPRLYRTYTTVTGLSHLEGELVSVMVDGALVASPLNDEQMYEGLIVSGGQITLPDGMRGSIIHVGRPIVSDVKTLNISTVEQAPTLIESITVNKLYVKVSNTRGLYCSNKFPEESQGFVDGSSVIGMEDLDESLVPVHDELIGNRYLPPVSKRIEKIIPGTWDNQGQICIRQVDPYHFEILSIIPDVTVLKRSDR